VEEPSALFPKLEASGEEDVRLKLAQGIWSEPRTVALIREWLALKDRARSDAASAKRDAREEETLAIARSALAIANDDLSIARDSAKSARTNARWALYSAITAVIAAAIATKDQILALILGNP